MKRLLLLLILALFNNMRNEVVAQCGPLTTLYAGNNGQDGIMFDITALNGVTITSFDMDLYGTTHNMAIYYKTGTHVGFETNSAAWTLLGTANNVVGNPRNSATAIPIPLSVSIPGCQTYAFYITSTPSGTSVSYTNGTAVGNVYAADANIQIKEGTGKSYPFGSSYTPRIPNITVHYNCTYITSCCPSPTMSQVSTSCSGICDGTATATVTGGAPPFTYQWNAAAGNQTTQTATGLCAGSYSVLVTDNNGCTTSGTVTVTSGSSAPNTTITPAGPFCPGDAAVNLTAATGGGTWSGTGITNATNGTFDPATAGPGTWTITYTIGGACGGSSTSTITVNPLQDPTITPAGPFCPGDAAVNLTAATGGGTWSGTGITSATNGTFDPATAGPGTWTITYTIGGTCGGSSTSTITVNPLQDPTITPAGPYCTSDAAVNLTAATSGGTWSGTGITDAINGTFDPATAGNGSWTITYTIPGNCGSSDNTTIAVNQQYDATITAAGPFCASDAALNLSAADPSGTWSGTGITDITNGTFDPATAGTGTWTITYTIAGACGSSATTDITVNPDHDATISAAGPFCTSDAAMNLSAAETGGVWSGNGITNTTNGTFDPATAGSGNSQIIYTISSACGDADTISIIVNQQMDATITPAGPYCESAAAVTLSSVDPGTWSGNGITDAANGIFDPSVAGPGTHTITCSIAGSCGDTKTIDITVNPDMDATITPSGPFCVNSSTVTLSAVDGGGIWNGPGITDTINGTFDPAIAGVGTWTIQYSIAGMCGDHQSTSIVVNANYDATITPVNGICADATAITLSAASPGGTWSGQGITDAVNGIFNPAFSGAGTWTVTYIIPGACGDTATTAVTVYALPVVSFSADTNSGCAPLAVVFTNNTSGSVDCNWNFGAGGTSTSCGNASAVFAPGVYDVTLTTVDNNGCMNSLTLNNYIQSFANPVADFTFGPQPTTVLNSLIHFQDASTGGYLYNWDFAGLGSSTAVDPDFTFQEVGSYDVTLYITSQDGCMDSTTKTVSIGEDFILYVPNSFSPNNDGKNDLFLPVVEGVDPTQYSFYIFNRWGELLFESHTPGTGWDGYYRGILSPEATYVWRIVAISSTTGSLTEKFGHVNLLR